MLTIFKYSPVYIALMIGACTSEPIGPNVTVLPGYGKNYSQFNADELDCQQYASDQVNGMVRRGNDRAIESAVIGTAVGAVAGGAIGGGEGAAVGAGAGLVVGSAVGANSSEDSSYNAQRRYDRAYQQCMYSRGNSVPGWGAPPPSAPPPRRY